MEQNELQANVFAETDAPQAKLMKQNVSQARFF